MTRKPSTLFTATAIIGGLLAATAVFAEENKSSPQPPHAAQGTAGDHGGMMNMMGQMSPDHMKQMRRMIDNCNRTMESMNNAPTGPDPQPAPDTHH
jgi:hypothetical protein